MRWPAGSRAGGVFVVSVGLPSAAKVQRYAGTVGAVIYLATLTAVVVVATRLGIRAWATSIQPRRATALMVVSLVVLALAFVVIHPHVTSGSDRDEALDLATGELLHGRFPYHQRVFATGTLPRSGGGSAISPMPGELLLAAPFVVLGSGAWQTFFWLAAFFTLARTLLVERGCALLALWSILSAPAGLHEILTGGDLLANSLWVLVLGAMTIKARGEKAAVASSVLLGIGLSSRMHFALLLPTVFVVLAQARGWQVAVSRCALAAGSFLAVTLPFYLYDPAGFSPLHVVGKLAALDWGVPHTVVVASVIGSVAAAVVLARGAPSDARALTTSAIVLGVPVVVAVVMACAREGAGGFAEYGWYAVSSMPFGVAGAFALGRAGGQVGPSARDAQDPPVGAHGEENGTLGDRWGT